MRNGTTRNLFFWLESFISKRVISQVNPPLYRFHEKMLTGALSGRLKRRGHRKPGGQPLLRRFDTHTREAIGPSLDHSV